MKKLFLASVLFLAGSAAFAADECAVVSTPVCDPMPSVCSAPAAGELENVYYEVPVRKKIVLDEVYTVEEKRTKIEKEVRTKTINPNSPRVARVVKGNTATVKLHRDLHREETYIQPVKVVYTVPVTKTRKVTAEVEEMELIPASKMHRRR